MAPTNSGSLIAGGARGMGAEHRHPVASQQPTADEIAVGRIAALLRDIVRSGRSHTHRPQDNGYVAQLAKDVLSRVGDRRHIKCLELTAALIADIGARGELEDAEAVGYMLIAVARHAHHSAHPDYTKPVRSMRELRLAEEQAEAEQELAETRFDYEPTQTNRLALLRATATHMRAEQEMLDGVRSSLVAV